MRDLKDMGSGWIAAAGCIIVIAVLAIIYAIQGGRREAMRQEFLASRETLDKSAAQLSETVQSYKTRLSDLENENKALKEGIEKERERINYLNKKVTELIREDNHYSKKGTESRKDIMMLQSRLANKKNKREISPQLSKYWPVIKKKAPDFIDHYKSIYPDFGRDAFVSREYEPRSHVGAKENVYYGDIVGVLIDCTVENHDYRVCSSDETKCISTGVSSLDADSKVCFDDNFWELSFTIAPCGAACRYTHLTWLDEDTFMFVNHYHSSARTDPDIAGDMVVPIINIYRTLPEYSVSKIGEHVGPPVDYDKFHDVDWALMPTKVP